MLPIFPVLLLIAKFLIHPCFDVYRIFRFTPMNLLYHGISMTLKELLWGMLKDKTKSTTTIMSRNRSARTFKSVLKSVLQATNNFSKAYKRHQKDAYWTRIVANMAVLTSKAVCSLIIVSFECWRRRHFTAYEYISPSTHCLTRNMDWITKMRLPSLQDMWTFTIIYSDVQKGAIGILTIWKTLNRRFLHSRRNVEKYFPVISHLPLELALFIYRLRVRCSKGRYQYELPPCWYLWMKAYSIYGTHCITSKRTSAAI